MLKLTVPERTGFDERKGVFYDTPSKTYSLEHSLEAMSLWEAETNKCFLDSQIMGNDFILYIRCMAGLDMVEEDAVYLKNRYGMVIRNYIYSDRTAKRKRSFGALPREQSARGKFLPTEKIYATLIESGIPMAVEKWHFSRLSALIGIMSKKNKKGGRMSAAQWNQFANINNARLNGG